MRPIVLAVALSVCLAPGLFAAEGGRGKGTMKIDGQTIALVDAFAYSGERIDYDEEGNAHPHFNLVLTAARYDAAIAASSEPVSNFNEWLYVEEPASLDIHLRPELQTEFMQAAREGEFHVNPVRCYCDGAVSDVTLEDGRLRGRIRTPGGLKSRHEGEDDPSAGRTLEFDVTFDVPVIELSR